MATGTGLPISGQSGPDVSGLGGVVQVSSAGSDMWRAVGQGAEDVRKIIQPELNRRAQNTAVGDATAGRVQERLAINPEDIAYNNALEITYTAGASQDIEDRLTQLSEQYQNDPAGFQAAAQAAQSSYIQNAPEQYAPMVEREWAKSIGTTSSRIATAKRNRDFQIAAKVGEQRKGILIDRAKALVVGGAALDSPDVMEALDQANTITMAMTRNPLVAYGEEQAQADIAEAYDSVGAAFVARSAFTSFQEGGFDAGTATIAEAMKSPAFANLPPERRERVLQDARKDYAQRVTDVRQAENQARAEENERQRKMNEALDEDVGQTALSGKGSIDLTAQEIQAVLGADGYVKYLDRKAKAYQTYQDVGDLSLMTPAAAAARVAAVQQEAASFKSLPTSIDGNVGFEQLAQSVEWQESRGRSDAVSPKGALGLMQVMPETGRELHRRLGLPGAYDPARLKSDPAYNRLLGRQYLREQLTKYDGSPVLALAAYNAGPGAVDGWLKSIGDPRRGQITDEEFAARIPFKETREYVASIATRMGSGRAEAAAKAYDGMMELRQRDTATMVMSDPVVRMMAGVAGQAGGVDKASNEAWIDASIEAQKRADVKMPRALPLATTARMAARFAPLDDDMRSAALFDLRAQLVETYGKHADMVMAEVMEAVSGNEFAGRAASGLVANGGRPTPQVRTDAQAAAVTAPPEQALRDPPKTTGRPAPRREATYGTEPNPVRIYARGRAQQLAQLAPGTVFLDTDGSVKRVPAKAKTDAR